MVLITGYEGYGGRGANPSQQVAQALDGTTIAGHEVRGVVLPDYAEVRKRVTASEAFASGRSGTSVAGAGIGFLPHADKLQPPVSVFREPGLGGWSVLAGPGNESAPPWVIKNGRNAFFAGP